MHRVKLGLEVLLEQQFDMVRGKRVGLVANQSSVNHNLVHIIEALRSYDVNIVALFGPEHGVRGDVPAGREVPSGADPRTGIPIHSLFGPTKKPTAEMLQGIDVMLFDIQDIGCRFYTFIYTMSYVLQACGEHHIPFVVLDRPNPINGNIVEGNIPEKGFASFVGLHPIPIRHGMTAGELALFFNDQFFFHADVQVVPCVGWRRPFWFDETDLQWVLPSPNMPTLDTATIYPGTCLFEGTNVSEGRGTAKPFELIGAPWIDAYALAAELNAAILPGVRFRPAYFVPTSSKYAQQQCAGVQIHIMDRASIDPVKVGLCAVSALHRMYPEMLQFVGAGKAGKPFFDLLTGTDKVRLCIENDAPLDSMMGLWYHDLGEFVELRKRCLLYY